MTSKLHIVLLFGFLVMFGGVARAGSPGDLAPEQSTQSLEIGGGTLAMAVAAGAGVGVVGTLVAGETVLAVGVGTLAAIYVGHLLVEAILVGGAIYAWPEDEESVRAARPLLKVNQPSGKGGLRLIALR